nr:hypothetical protein [Tanacetum cinerariifolium]
MHTSRDDYLINTLRFFSAKEETQIYGAILPKCLTSPEMKETQAYLTYLGFAIGATPLKKAYKFKKPASPKLTTILVSTEEPMGKSKSVKRPTKKSTKASERGVVIKETPKMPLFNKKEKMTVERRKGIDMLSETRPSGSGTATKTAPSVAKIKPSVTSEETGVKPGVPDVTEEESSENNENESDFEHETDDSESSSESDHEENEEDEDDDEEEVKDELVKTPSNDSDDDTKFLVKQKKTEVPVTSSSHSSDLAAKFLNFSDIPHTDAEIVSPLDVHVHHEVPSQQTPTLLTVDEHLDARLGATKDEFMNFVLTSITARITEQVKNQLPQILSKEMSNFAPPVIQSMVTESLEQAILIYKIDKSKSYLEAPEHREYYEGLKKSYDLDKTFFSTYGKVYSLKRRQKDKDKDEDPFAGSDRGLNKRKTSKDAEPTKGPKAKESQSSSSKSDKSKSKSSRKSVQSEEPEFESKTFDELMSILIDFSTFIMNDLNIKNITQETLLGPAFRLLKGTRSNYAELEYDFEECYKSLSEKLDLENPKDGDYPFDLTKPLPLVKIGNRQKVPVDYFFNNDLKYLQGGILTMTYTTSLTKIKAAQYDLLGIEDMKKINVTRPETTKSYIRKKDPYTPYQDPQRLIYVDDSGRNRLMRSDEMYNFDDGTLIRLRTSLGDITKNIRMEYLTKRRWSTLEKKRANIMIKAIDKHLKERRMMRSLKKFFSRRDYGTDLWLLQRTI